MVNRQSIMEQFKTLQSYICDTLETADGTAKFSKEPWEHHSGGGGLTRVIQKGALIQKGGVNFSGVEGILPGKIAQALKLPLGKGYFATGVSIVIHPQNPYAPIMHMNVRYFELEDGTYWFGGGIDMTPHYINLEDAHYFHKEVKKICDAFHPDAYKLQKEAADHYFFIPHRNETRGIGGTFFDHLKENESYSKLDLLNYCCSILNLFPKVYSHFIQKNQQSYGERELLWQGLRRGRYVEFNLVYDKGTKFGLDTNGRIESILMSLPEHANWVYNFVPEVNSPEAFTLDYLKKGIDWISII